MASQSSNLSATAKRRSIARVARVTITLSLVVFTAVMVGYVVISLWDVVPAELGSGVDVTPRKIVNTGDPIPTYVEAPQPVVAPDVGGNGSGPGGSQ